MNYVFLGTPAFAATILEKVAREIGPPLLVVTQSAKATGRGQKLVASAVEELAKKNQWPVLGCDDINQPEINAELKKLTPDLILVAAFGQLLKDEILNLPKRYCLNVHGSLLPAYRGAAPVQRAIWNGDKVTGVTVQRMVRKLDAGDIVLQSKMEIDPKETSGQLMDRMAVVGAQTLVDCIRLIEQKKEKLIAQEESKATFAKKLQKEEAAIPWNLSAEAIYNRIRALQPWPVAETTLGKDKLKIFGALVKPSAGNSAPGTIKTDQKTYLDVACGQGVLSLTEIQLENRKRLSIKDFLMGYRGSFPHLKVGEI